MLIAGYSEQTECGGRTLTVCSQDLGVEAEMVAAAEKVDRKGYYRSKWSVREQGMSASDLSGIAQI